MRERLRRLLREPLLHFMGLGALLFIGYGWLHRGLGDERREIVVSQGQLASLQAQFKRVWERPPTQAEMNGLIEHWVHEQVLYREGLALGLDRDDPVVLRRVAQKVEFLADGLMPAKPTTAEMQTWLEEHRGRYLVAPNYTLRQIYFDPSRRQGRLDDDVDAARRELLGGKSVSGDTTMLPSTLNAASEAEVIRVFGTEFAEQLPALRVGEWSTPIRSGFGVHLVEVLAREAGRPAALDEVRAAVERDLIHARTEEANATFYDKLRASYTVRINDSH
jgi:PPIC-type PPIASE domain